MQNQRRQFLKTIARLKRRWQRITHRTSRAAGVAMCLMLLSAVVVGGSHVMPFAEVQSETTGESQETDAESTEPRDNRVTRQLTRTDYNESWLQAGDDWDRLGDVSRRHQVLITPDGQLTGRILSFADWRGDVEPFANAQVHLVRDGRVAAHVTSDADGRFVADGLSEGTYGLIVQSQQGLLAYALHLRTASDDAEAIEFQLQSMAATSWDADAIVGRVTEYWQSEPPQERTREPELDEIPNAVVPVPQDGQAATTLGHHQVRLQEDGRLLGRLRRLHPQTGRPIVARQIEVALYRNGSLQAVTWTDEIGYFEFPRVAPGVYSLVATGSGQTDVERQIAIANEQGLRDGFLAFGIEVLPAEGSYIQTVVFNTAPVLEIDAALVDLADIQPFLGSPSANITNANTPFAGNGGSAGTGGSAAGGGGVGGGLGAALAVGAAASLPFLLDDDDGVISNARP